MPNSPLVLVNLVIVSTGRSLVTEEVDGIVLDTIREFVIILDVPEAEGLVPTGGKDVEGDLAANGVSVADSQPSNNATREDRKTCVRPKSGNSFFSAATNFSRI